MIHQNRQNEDKNEGDSEEAFSNLKASALAPNY